MISFYMLIVNMLSFNRLNVLGAIMLDAIMLSVVVPNSVTKPATPSIIKWVTLNKSSLLLKIDLQKYTNIN